LRHGLLPNSLSYIKIIEQLKYHFIQNIGVKIIIYLSTRSCFFCSNKNQNPSFFLTFTQNWLVFLLFRIYLR
jgi:hypothetical protein